MKKLIILVVVLMTSCSSFVVPETHEQRQKATKEIAKKEFRKDKIKRQARLVGIYLFCGIGAYLYLKEEGVDLKK